MEPLVSGPVAEVAALLGSPVAAAVVPTCHTEFCRTATGWIIVFIVVSGIPALAALFGLAAWEKRRPQRTPHRTPTLRYVVPAAALGFLMTVAVSDVLEKRGQSWWLSLATPVLVSPVAWGVSRLRFLG
jgi:hypothetical protein